MHVGVQWRRDGRGEVDGWSAGRGAGLSCESGAKRRGLAGYLGSFRKMNEVCARVRRCAMRDVLAQVLGGQTSLACSGSCGKHRFCGV